MCIRDSLWTAYLLTIFFVVAGFAVYDVLYRRVPDRALVFFIPLACLLYTSGVAVGIITRIIRQNL